MRLRSPTVSLRRAASAVSANLIHGTTLPLRLLSRLGLLCAAVALVLGIVYFVRWLAGFDSVDYIEVRDPATLELVTEPGKPARVFGAARLGATRLIDNWPVD